MSEYTTVRLPKELTDEIDKIVEGKAKVKGKGYKSRAEFVKEACRKRIEELSKT